MSTSRFKRCGDGLVSASIRYTGIRDSGKRSHAMNPLLTHVALVATWNGG